MKPKKIPLFFLILFTLFLFQQNELIQKTILSSCELFLTKLFPSLFPMMILSDLFLYFGLPDLLCKYFGSLFQKLFHTSPYGAFAFFISCFSGTPSNAYVIKNLYLENCLSKEEASKILSFSFFSNPLFLYTMLNFIFPHQNSLVLKILFLPYLVNILIGLTMKPTSNSFSTFTKKEKLSFGNFLSNSIQNAMHTLLFILGTITLFFLINALLNPHQEIFISGLLEISQGLNALIASTYSIKLKEILSVIMISFGGLSIHLQIKGILNETPISYIEFLKGRIKQTVLSVLFVFFI